MTNPTRRDFMRAALGAAATAGGLAGCVTGPDRAGRAGAKPPNFLVILTDDQHYQAMGCAGNPVILTPNIDALARGGVMFTEAFVTTPICCTSRASILTGMYAWSNGVHDFATNIPDDLYPNTYPAVLRAHGYYTGFVGKYGVSSGPPEGIFDVFSGLPGDGAYFQEIDGETRHMTSLLADASVAFLETCPDDQPFCFSLSTRVPHAEDYAPRPYPPDPDFEHLYTDAQIPVPELADPKYYDALPEFLKETEGRVRWRNRFSTPGHAQESLRDYYRMIAGVDHAVGRMREVLERRGMADNTVIVFLSDNGYFFGHRGMADKWYAYEDSIRIPLIIHDPRLPATLRGRQADPMALNIDIAPTLFEMAGVPTPETTQGESLVPFLRGDWPDWRKSWMFEHRFEHKGIPKSEGVRTTRWKYFRWLEVEPEREELYDLDADPQEINNLAQDPAHARVLTEMRDLLERYKTVLPERIPAGKDSAT
jgi:arylsulfatase A-like enzyme